MSRSSPSTEDGAASLADAITDARALTASPLLYVGALTVVLSHEIVELSPLSDLSATVAIFFTALAVLYAQLAALSYFGWADARGCGC